MRIDDLNRAPQAHEAEKTGAAQPDRVKSRDTPASAEDADAADISTLAASALASNSLASAPSKADQSRIEALRLQIERGEYNVSSDEIAASIIDHHIVG